MSTNEEAKFNVGDRVYVYSSGFQAITKGVISRVTNTQAIITNERYEQKFNRETGRLIGGGTWNSSAIAHPTERLDREWHEQKVFAARRELAEIARVNSGDDAHVLRAAFEKWDRLQGSSGA